MYATANKKMLNMLINGVLFFKKFTQKQGKDFRVSETADKKTDTCYIEM